MTDDEANPIITSGHVGALGLIGYGVKDGDLVYGIGGGFETMPVHAYIPMVILPSGRHLYVEDSPVAYRNQMRAKRIADAARKRHKRRNPNSRWKFIVVGITVK